MDLEEQKAHDERMKKLGFVKVPRLDRDGNVTYAYIEPTEKGTLELLKFLESPLSEDKDFQELSNCLDIAAEKEKRKQIKIKCKNLFTIIPQLKGRPNRDTVISRRDMIDLRIALNSRHESFEAFLRVV